MQLELSVTNLCRFRK